MSEQRNQNDGTITKELVAVPTHEAQKDMSDTEKMILSGEWRLQLYKAGSPNGAGGAGIHDCIRKWETEEGEAFTEAALRALRAAQEWENLQPLQRAFALACRILADNTMLCPQEIFETEWEECDGEYGKCGDCGMWKCWQRFIKETVEEERVCRVCGCTEHNACVERDGHDNCYWIEDDLCSACVTEPAEGKDILTASDWADFGVLPTCDLPAAHEPKGDHHGMGKG